MVGGKNNDKKDMKERRAIRQSMQDKIEKEVIGLARYLREVTNIYHKMKS